MHADLDLIAVNAMRVHASYINSRAAGKDERLAGIPFWTSALRSQMLVTLIMIIIKALFVLAKRAGMQMYNPCQLLAMNHHQKKKKVSCRIYELFRVRPNNNYIGTWEKCGCHCSNAILGARDRRSDR